MVQQFSSDAVLLNYGPRQRKKEDLIVAASTSLTTDFSLFCAARQSCDQRWHQIAVFAVRISRFVILRYYCKCDLSFSIIPERGGRSVSTSRSLLLPNYCYYNCHYDHNYDYDCCLSDTLHRYKPHCSAKAPLALTDGCLASAGGAGDRDHQQVGPEAVRELGFCQRQTAVQILPERRGRAATQTVAPLDGRTETDGRTVGWGEREKGRQVLFSSPH